MSSQAWEKILMKERMYTVNTKLWVKIILCVYFFLIVISELMRNGINNNNVVHYLSLN